MQPTPSLRRRQKIGSTALLFAAVAGFGCTGSDGGTGLDAAVTDAGAPDTGSASDGGDVSDAGDAGEVGATDAGGAPDGGPAGGGSRVFVTSTTYTGNLGGLSGGDALCQARADAAALGGTWLAWLGDGTDGPATRFVHSDAEYRLVGGGVVATSWTDLIDGTIGVPLDHDETGTALPMADDMIVWTAVFHTGGNPTPVHCSGWTSSEVTLVPTGLASATDTGWTVYGPNNCSEMHRLYCFEQ